MAKFDMDIGETIAICLIAFTLIVEIGLHSLEDKLRRHRHLTQMLHLTYRELTILGIIAFSLFLIEIGGGGITPDEKHTFETIHIAVFLVTILYLLTVVMLMANSIVISRKWNRFEEKEFSQWIKYKKEFDDLRAQRAQMSWLGFHVNIPFYRHYQNILEHVRFHDLRCHFLISNHLDNHFNFASYLKKCKQHVFLELVEIHWSVWLFISTILFLEMFVRNITGGWKYSTDSAQTLFIVVAAILTTGPFIVWVKLKRIMSEIMHSDLIDFDPFMAAELHDVSTDHVSKMLLRKKSNLMNRRSQLLGIEETEGSSSDDDEETGGKHKSFLAPYLDRARSHLGERYRGESNASSEGPGPNKHGGKQSNGGNSGGGIQFITRDTTIDEDEDDDDRTSASSTDTDEIMAKRRRQSMEGEKHVGFSKGSKKDTSATKRQSRDASQSPQTAMRTGLGGAGQHASMPESLVNSVTYSTESWGQPVEANLTHLEHQERLFWLQSPMFTLRITQGLILLAVFEMALFTQSLFGSEDGGSFFAVSVILHVIMLASYFIFLPPSIPMYTWAMHIGQFVDIEIVLEAKQKGERKRMMQEQVADDDDSDDDSIDLQSYLEEGLHGIRLWQFRVGVFVERVPVQSAIAVAVLLDFGFVAMSYVPEYDSVRDILEGVQYFVLSVLILDQVLKFFAFGHRYYWDTKRYSGVYWNCFDFILTAVSLTTAILRDESIGVVGLEGLILVRCFQFVRILRIQRDTRTVTEASKDDLGSPRSIGSGAVQENVFTLKKTLSNASAISMQSLTDVRKAPVTAADKLALTSGFFKRSKTFMEKEAPRRNTSRRRTSRSRSASRVLRELSVDSHMFTNTHNTNYTSSEDYD
eukprot:GFYU01011220.1.p1 GENE.GFYU01011220.1~~GFYU01011220.1.p1  ORF type:complete len:866 (-),score=275.98 GFYU01011220.1:39-2636(-)